MSKFDLGWPWMGLGAAVVLLILMFGTDTMRSRTTGSRWWDPVWLSWLVVPMYMLHQFGEYTLHYDLTSRTYSIVESVCKAQGYAPYPDCPIPLSHFPLVNIALVWVAAPLAAWLCRRDPVVGLTYYGFLIANGLLHAVGTLAAGGGMISNPGAVTGILLFVPASVWMVYVCLKSGFMTGKALAVSLAGGIAGHLGLFGAYWFLKIGGAAGMLVADVVIAFLPILVAEVGSKLLGPPTMTPVRGTSA
jgi:hypothetical protein